jgi:RNA polymerase-associated protein CTR9
MPVAAPQVQEAASGCVDWLHLPDVAINLANLYLAQRQIPAAIQLYTTTLQKHYKNNSTIMLYLARALYDDNKNSQAKRVLLKAIHLQPTQTLLRFNSAVTMQVRLLCMWCHTTPVAFGSLLTGACTSGIICCRLD